MSAADPIPLDALSDQNRAILSLLLVQGRGYHEIAELLRIDPVRVRDRAHAAIETLAPSQPPRPGAAARARIADYLVGEQSVSERALTRAQLAGSESERAWAAGVALALAPLAKIPLPAIPDLDPTGPAADDPAPPAERDPAPPAERDPAPPAAGDRHSPSAAPDPDPPSDQGTLRPAARIACLGLLALVAVGVILVVALSGGSHQRTPTVATSAGRTIKRLILSPAGTDRTAVGAAAIVRPARGGWLLLLRGRGLPANQNDSYAVWLFNKPGDSRLLGFISPRVGAAGTFSSVTPLPQDAVHFRELIVTLETTSRPVAPGQAVLKTQLRLS